MPQVPKINRAASSADPSIGRLDANVAPVGEIQRKFGKALAGVGENFAESYSKILAKREEENAKITAKDVSNQYSLKANKIVEDFEAKGINGNDFTPEYANVNTQLRTEADNVINDKNLSETTRKLVKSELADRETMFKMRTDSNFARKNQAYRIAVTQADIKENKQLALSAASLIDPKDDSSFAPFETFLNKTDTSVKDFAQASGVAKSDASGFPIYDEKVLAEANKAKGEAVSYSINNLLASGDTDKSKALFVRYKDLIPEKEQDDMMKTFTKVVKEDYYKKVVGKIANLTETVGLQAIATEVPEADRDEVRKRFVAVKKEQIQYKERVNNQAQDTILKYINGQRLKGKTWSSEQEFTNDPRVATLFSKLSGNGQKAILSAAGMKPRITNQDSLEKLNTAYTSGEMQKWTPEQFESQAAGLNQKDYTKQRKKYEQNNSKTGLGVDQRRYMLPQIKSSLTGTLLPVTDNGRLTNKGQQVWNETIEDYLQVEMDKLPKNFTNSAERNQAEKRLTQEAIKKFGKQPEVKKKSWWDFSSDTPPAQPAVATPPADKAVLKSRMLGR